MFITLRKNHNCPLNRVISGLVAAIFVFTTVLPPASVSAQVMPASVLNLPAPGAMVMPSTGFNPPILDGITIYPNDPFKFDFLVDHGEHDLQGEAFETEAKRLINYFLAALTVPQDELWVNLSPYEQDRIIPESLSRTEMGRDMLIQDYMLKQLTASLMYPENELGQKFWDRIYAKAKKAFGTDDLPVDTFNKVWIVPQDATVYETENTAIVTSSYLKVMLESDYLAMENAKSVGIGRDRSVQDDPLDLSKQIIREIIIPEIEKEVNEGETFANLRQIYNSMILAAWYKQNLQESLLGQVYVNQNKVKGIDPVPADLKDDVYQQYLKAFNTGVYNYIREDIDPDTQEIVPRKYFAGGMSPVGSVGTGLSSIALRKADDDASLSATLRPSGQSASPAMQLREAVDVMRHHLDKTGKVSDEEVDTAVSVLIDRQDSEEIAGTVLARYFLETADTVSRSRGESASPVKDYVEAISLLNRATAVPGQFTAEEVEDAVEVLRDKFGSKFDLVQRGDKLLTVYKRKSESASPVTIDGESAKDAFVHAGFSEELASVAAQIVPSVLHSRKIYQDKGNYLKEEKIVSALVEGLKRIDGVLGISVPGEDTIRYVGGGEYWMSVIQDDYDLERKASLGVGTMIGIFEDEDLVGAVFVLDGPITVLAATDGEHFVHYAYNGEEFEARTGKEVEVDLSEPTSDSKSPAALGGQFKEWVGLFQDYYRKNNRRGVPGSSGNKLKPRYSAVLGEDGLQHGATGANLYQILVKNGFLAEFVSLEEAEIMSFFAQAAGGRAMIMTKDGPKAPSDVNGIRSVPVQVFLGNQDAVSQLADYMEERKSDYTTPDITLPKPPTMKQAAGRTDAIDTNAINEFGNFFEWSMPEMDEREDVINALKAVATAAQAVGPMYVKGSKATGVTDSGGADELTIDKQADLLFMMALKDWIKKYYSEDQGFVTGFEGRRDKLMAMIDALDGSSMVAANGAAGTILALRKFLPGVSIEEQTGEEIIASIVIAHNITPRMIIAVEGMGAHEFLLEGDNFYHKREIDFSKAAIDPAKGIRYGFGQDPADWPAGLPEYYDTLVEAGNNIYGYGGAFITDIFAAIDHIMEGGQALFSQATNKLRVKSELQAVAHLFWIAGGRNLTWTHKNGKPAHNIRDLRYEQLTPESDPSKQQKAPSFFGNKEAIETVEQVLLAAASPVAGAEKILAALTPNQRKMLSKERLPDTDPEIMAKVKAAGVDNEKAQIWIANAAKVMGFKNGKFVLVTQENEEELRAEARRKGEMVAVGNGTDVAFSHPEDVQRVVNRTFVVTSDERDKGKYNKWSLASKLNTALAKYENVLNGGEDEIIYILPYIMQPEGNHFSLPSIHLTTSLYVAIGTDLMANTGQAGLKEIEYVGDFDIALSNPGDLDKTRRQGDILRIKSDGKWEKIRREGEYIVYDHSGAPQLLSIFVVEKGKAVRKVIEGKSEIEKAIADRAAGLEGVEQINLDENERLHIVTVEEDDRNIVVVPELGLAESNDTGFGGNAFHGKKSQGLRQEQYRTTKALLKGDVYKVVDHAAFFPYVDPRTGKHYGMSYEAPSNSGKTHTGTMGQTLGEDLGKKWLEVSQGIVKVVQPETAAFMVMKDTTLRDNPNVFNAVGSGSNTIFTNMAFNPDLSDPNQRVWWKGKTPEFPFPIDGWRDYRNILISDRVVTQAHVDVSPFAGRDVRDLTESELVQIKAAMLPWDHPNGRGTTRLENFEHLSLLVKDPNGMEVQIILFGGRMSTPGRVPIAMVYDSLEEALFFRLAMAVEQTAAEAGAKVGELIIDPRAMRPFFGTNEIEDFNAQLKFYRKAKEAALAAGNKPILFVHVNWIHPKEFGQEGFRIPEEVFKWVIKMYEGDAQEGVDFERVAHGRVPARGAFDLSNYSTITDDVLEPFRKPDITSVRSDMDKYYWDFYKNLPHFDELDPAFRRSNETIRAKLGMASTAAGSPAQETAGSAPLSTYDNWTQVRGTPLMKRTRPDGSIVVFMIGDQDNRSRAQRYTRDEYESVKSDLPSENIPFYQLIHEEDGGVITSDKYYGHRTRSQNFTISDLNKIAAYQHRPDGTVVKLPLDREERSFIDAFKSRIRVFQKNAKKLRRNESARFSFAARKDHVTVISRVIVNTDLNYWEFNNTGLAGVDRVATIDHYQKGLRLRGAHQRHLSVIPEGKPQHEVGGIDLDAAYLNMKVERDGNGVPLPVMQQPLEIINIQGLVPVIINVAPVNMPLIFGSLYKEDTDPLADTDSEKNLDSARNEYFDKYTEQEELESV